MRKKIPSVSSFSTLVGCLCLLLHTTDAEGINGGAATAAGARAPHHTVVGTVWPASPDLVEPCTAVLLCNNVILTAAHCLNMEMAAGVADEKYMTLEVDMNTVAGPGGVAAPNRFQRVKAEFGRAQNTTRRIDNASIRYGEAHGFPAPGGRPAANVGLALAKLNSPLPAGLNYPNLVPQNFAFVQDPNPKLFEAPTIMVPNPAFLNPGAAATAGLVSGYGRSGVNDAGAGILRNGTMRFLTWYEPRTGNPQERRVPAAGSRNGFLLQFVHGAAGADAHGCPGDSGGPVFVSSGGGSRLTGIRELLSDGTCSGNIVGTSGHVDLFVNLVYTRNRNLIHNYMLDHCADRRIIDVTTGANTVRPAVPAGGEEEETAIVDDVAVEDDYFNSAPWVPVAECMMEQLFNFTPETGLQPASCVAHDPAGPVATPTPGTTQTSAGIPGPILAPGNQ